MHSVPYTTCYFRAANAILIAMPPTAEPLILPREFLRMCRRSRKRLKVADSIGTKLTGGELLLRTLILRRILLREVLGDDEKHVGLMLPPSAGAVVANAAIPLMGRVAVNLNYTLSPALINNCIRRCGIRHVLTSRKFIERTKIEVEAELVYLEDFAGKVTLRDKIAAVIQARLLPIARLERNLGLTDIKPDDLLTIIFTSGSTGDPKGVMLTHENVGSNLRAINQAIRLSADDVAIGVLPFFHSYGYTAALWTVLTLDPTGAYHFNPTEAHPVGKLCREYKVTVFMATPTFLRTYLKRCEPQDFATLDVVFGAAERVPPELFSQFETKFGVRPLEAYGCTELSPLVAVNVPPSRSPHGDPSGVREGTVGRPIPGVKVKVVNPETWEERPRGESGMLLVSGPNVMKGYLNQPEATARVIRDGWYITGDLATIDADGFITITGRESRFSKLGGEMVPHVTIEDALQKILSGDDDHIRAVVTAVPDPRKGERLVVLHLPTDKTPEQIRQALTAAGLPNLWIPSQDSFLQVEHIPVLGTGKLDLKAMRELAQAKFANPAATN
jgi:acyl-[acyl-carrier-protein]-phospholipid O-acyltransferase / long-chain-fatty-acid--[acyl-carrier-protein] ligase